MENPLLKNIDLRLLSIFTEMVRTRSVSETANNLNASQPSVSMSLSRLRKYFNDPLFVRTSRGMEPTPRALDLQAPLTRAYQLLNDATQSRSSFDPHTSDRFFRIAMTDTGYLSVFPRLLELQKRTAPNIRFDFSFITEKTGKLMQTGEIDLTLAFLPQLGTSGVYQQLLLEQTFVAAVRHHHPRIRTQLSIKDYEQESHLVISPAGTGYWVLNGALERAGVQRKIGWQVQSILGILPIVGNSDYIVTIPSSAAQFLQQQGLVRVFPLPFSTPTFTVMQYWHERFHRDSGLQWLRNQLVGLFSEESDKLLNKPKPASAPATQAAPPIR